MAGFQRPLTTVDLAVTGSTPVPTRRLITCPTRPEGGGPTCDRPSAASDRRRRGFWATRPMGAGPGGIGAQPAYGCHVAARPSAMQCVDTASTGFRQAAVDAWRLAPGPGPVATSQVKAAVSPKAVWMLKRHSAPGRVIAAGPAAQRLCPAPKRSKSGPRPQEGR
jgi:hypothetical protein